jgi:predicted ATP-binding protein involved in virulence
MKVKRLTMQAFRGIDDLTLEFHPNVTVLIGVNGVGKSSVLACLSRLLTHFTFRLTSFHNPFLAFNSPIPDSLNIKNDKEELFVSILTLIQSRQVSWSLKTQREKFEEISGEELINLTDEFNKISSSRIEGFKSISPANFRFFLSLGQSLSEILESEIFFQESVEELGRSLIENRSNVRLPILLYYTVHRTLAIPEATLPEERGFSPLDAYEGAFNGVTNFTTFLSWFRNEEDLENELKVDNSQYISSKLEAVRRAISSLIPEFSSLRVRRSPLRMTVEKQGQELIINQLSDGEKCLLAMVGDIARRLAIANPGLSDPLQGEGIVLIDEIELHLHPQWQRGILPKLTKTFPNCQFIVTTHSPQVISDVQPESVIILESEDGKVVAKHPQSSFGRDSNQILEDLMDTPQRREDIQDKIQQLFRLIAESHLEAAKALQENLAEEIGADEPELVGARAAIRRKEILGK